MLRSKLCGAVQYFPSRTGLACLSSQQTRLQTSIAPQLALDKNLKEEWQQARSFEKIPKETTFKFLRNLLPGGNYHKMNSIKMIFKLCEKYGDIFMIPAMLGRSAILFTTNPADIERVFRNENIWPVRPGSEVLAYHREKHRAEFFQGTEGLISTNGEKWGSFRSVVNPVLMQPKNVKFYLPKMSKVNFEFIERIREIRDEKTLEVPSTFEEEINRWTLESVSVVALDKQLGLIKANRDNPTAKIFFQNLTEFFTLSGDLELKPPIWKYMKGKKFKQAMQSLDNIQEITLNYVNEALDRLEEDRKNGVVRAENEKSVLEKLLAIDKKVAIVMAMDMIMAGVDTTSSTFTGAMLCLAKNPEKQNKLREELCRILPEKDSPFTESTLNDMTYLRCCIKEALRIYPLAAGNARVPQNDLVLSGYKVPKGTQVFMMAETLLKNENYYPRANEYLPERWLRQGKETNETKQCPNPLKSTNPFIYLPFGFGSRACIGRRIAEMEMELGLARIVRNFKVEFNHPTENAFRTLLFNVPNIPLKFKFTDV